MIEDVLQWFINNGVLLVGSGLGSIFLGWLLAKIPTGEWAKSFEKFGHKQGIAVTTFFNRWKWSKSFYEKLLEPVIIDTVDAVLFAWVRGFIVGLKSDNVKNR
jgi:hypothetical protein